MKLWNSYTDPNYQDKVQKQIAELKKQIDDVVKQIADIDKKLNAGGLSNSKRRELQNQKSTLVTQKTNYENQKKELEKPVNEQIEKIEKQMRSRLTVYYNPDIIITYQQHAVEVKPAEIPDFTITIPSDYDRIKK